VVRGRGGGCREPVPRTLGLADNAMSLIGKKRLFFSDLMASPTPVGVIFILKTTIQVVFIFLKEKKYNYYLPEGAARGAGGGCQEGHPYTVYCFLGGQYQPEEVNLSL